MRDGELRQITDDHSLVEEMVRGGELTPEQAEVHPQRSIITRALGIDPMVDVDLYPIELQAGDRILLCSDGLTTMVRPEEIANILGREPDPRRAAQLLVDAANAAGGEDNITAVIVEAIEDLDDEPVAAPLVDDDHDGTDAGAPPAKPRRRRGRTLLRVAMWALPILLVLAVAFGFVGWYARNTYYVGTDRGRVTVFQGIKGGLLIWDPTVEQRTDIDPGDLTQPQQEDVQAGKKFSSRSGADAYVRRLRQGVDERATAATTTVPPPTTALPPAPTPS
jgi:protein phosphatase